MKKFHQILTILALACGSATAHRYAIPERIRLGGGWGCGVLLNPTLVNQRGKEVGLPESFLSDQRGFHPGNRCRLATTNLCHRTSLCACRRH